MKKNRILALLLSAVMLLALCACGNGAGKTAPSAPQESTVSSEAPTETAQAPEAPTEENSALPEDSAAETAASDSRYLYPVFDELTTIEAFLNIAPWASAYIGPDAEFENAHAILAAEEVTNVHLDVDWSDPDTYNEKLDLLVAANDLPHITRNLGQL